jgi:hypothetical protein
METPQDVFEYIIEAMAAEGSKGQDVDPGAASKGEGP